MSSADEQDVERRLRAADPTPSGRTLLPSGRTLADLVEATMSRTDTPTTPTTPTRSRPWPLIGLAAAVIATLLAGGIYLLARHDTPTTTSAATPNRTVLTLSLPKPAAGPTMQTCIRFSTETLAPMQLAFSGTVTHTDQATVTVTVDHWYRGGSADEVRLSVPDPTAPTTAEGMVELRQGHRYLVTANDGVVTTCGFTTEWTADIAATFAAAFEK